MIILSIEMIGATPNEQMLRTRKTIQERLINIFQKYGNFEYSEAITISSQKQELIFVTKPFMIENINDIQFSLINNIEQINNLINKKEIINPEALVHKINIKLKKIKINIKVTPKKNIQGTPKKNIKGAPKKNIKGTPPKNEDIFHI